jgi:hypothetical protein
MCYSDLCFKINPFYIFLGIFAMTFKNNKPECACLIVSEISGLG